MSPLELVDPKRNPYLSGRFAPVHREIDAADLTVEGHLPVELTGAYVRNGPNPKFPPLGSYTYPMEGDGMLHGVWLDGGRPRYRNRWVETRGLQAEERAGRALFGGLMTPAFVDPSVLGPDPDPGWPIKLDAFINIVRHAGRYLALEEGTPPYEVTDALETVGRYDFAGGLPAGMCAHPKVDPRTGDMVLFRYDVEEPFLSWAVVGADGRVSRACTADPAGRPRLHGPRLRHHGAPPRALPRARGVRPGRDERGRTAAAVEAGARACGSRWCPATVMARIGWIESDTFWVWHLANAYEDGGNIVVDFPAFNTLGFLDPHTPVAGA